MLNHVADQWSHINAGKKRTPSFLLFSTESRFTFKNFFLDPSVNIFYDGVFRVLHSNLATDMFINTSDAVLISSAGMQVYIKSLRPLIFDVEFSSSSLDIAFQLFLVYMLF